MWGALAATTRSEERLPDGLERRLCDFADLVGQALANADARERLAASRAELVEVGDAERRRLERNLHDGAQQRLVSVALELRMAARKARERPWRRPGALSAAQHDLAKGLEELRELARGIHPAMLTERGLGRGARRSSDAVALAGRDLRAAGCTPRRAGGGGGLLRRRGGVTNVAKYAHASHATVSIVKSDGSATVTVCDDGVGGADPAGGSGLRGLAARVEALNGRLEVDSPSAGGTRIEAEISLRQSLRPWTAGPIGRSGAAASHEGGRWFEPEPRPTRAGQNARIASYSLNDSAVEHAAGASSRLASMCWRVSCSCSTAQAPELAGWSERGDLSHGRRVVVSSASRLASAE